MEMKNQRFIRRTYSALPHPSNLLSVECIDTAKATGSAGLPSRSHCKYPSNDYGTNLNRMPTISRAYPIGVSVEKPGWSSFVDGKSREPRRRPSLVRGLCRSQPKAWHRMGHVGTLVSSNAHGSTLPRKKRLTKEHGMMSSP